MSFVRFASFSFYLAAWDPALEEGGPGSLHPRDPPAAAAATVSEERRADTANTSYKYHMLSITFSLRQGAPARIY